MAAPSSAGGGGASWDLHKGDYLDVFHGGEWRLAQVVRINKDFGQLKLRVWLPDGARMQSSANQFTDSEWLAPHGTHTGGGTAAPAPAVASSATTATGKGHDRSKQRAQHKKNRAGARHSSKAAKATVAPASTAAAAAATVQRGSSRSLTSGGATVASKPSRGLVSHASSQALTATDSQATMAAWPSSPGASPSAAAAAAAASTQAQKAQAKQPSSTSQPLWHSMFPCLKGRRQRVAAAAAPEAAPAPAPAPAPATPEASSGANRGVRVTTTRTPTAARRSGSKVLSPQRRSSAPDSPGLRPAARSSFSGSRRGMHRSRVRAVAAGSRLKRHTSAPASPLPADDNADGSQAAEVSVSVSEAEANGLRVGVELDVKDIFRHKTSKGVRMYHWREGRIVKVAPDTVRVRWVRSKWDSAKYDTHIPRSQWVDRFAPLRMYSVDAVSHRVKDEAAIQAVSMASGPSQRERAHAHSMLMDVMNGGEFVDFQRPSGKWVLAKVLREEAGAAWVEDLGTGKRELVSIATGRLASCGAFTEESKEDLERQDDESFFAATLESSGMRIEKMDSDGNCLFRALSHQVYGTPSKHAGVRKSICDHMEARPARFSMQVSDSDEGFTAYMKRMRQACEWGGQGEIMAAEEVYDRPVVIYDKKRVVQANELVNLTIHFTSDLPPSLGTDVKPMMLSFHDGQHYNSVYKVDDPPPHAPRRSSVICNYRDAGGGTPVAARVNANKAQQQGLPVRAGTASSVFGAGRSSRRSNPASGGGAGGGAGASSASTSTTGDTAPRPATSPLSRRAGRM